MLLRLTTPDIDEITRILESGKGIVTPVGFVYAQALDPTTRTAEPVQNTTPHPSPFCHLDELVSRAALIVVFWYKSKYIHTTRIGLTLERRVTRVSKGGSECHTG